MKKSYDILVNYQKIAYEFYDWNKTDDVKHIKVIPTFKVSDKCLQDFYNYDLMVDRTFLDMIKDKTEIFIKGLTVKEPYACVLFSSYSALSFKFDKQGNVIGKSNLLFDEADDIITTFYSLEETKINYKVTNMEKLNSFYTRYESKMIDDLINYLKQIQKNSNDYETKYIYFECFNKEIDSSKKAYEKLFNSVNKLDFKVIEKLKNLMKVLKK